MVIILFITALGVMIRLKATGSARLKDIVFRVESPYKARPCITDQDDRIDMFVENLSGKEYAMEDPILEKYSFGIWRKMNYVHANRGLLSGWESSSGSASCIRLDKPLKVGKYRITLPMHTYNDIPTEKNKTGRIKPKYEFTVIVDEDASKPEWDIANLQLSFYNGLKSSTEVALKLANSDLDAINTTLDITVTAKRSYTYGEEYGIEVLLDDKWYYVPFANSDFNLPAYGVDKNEEKKLSYNLIHTCGLLPTGQYRLVKIFELTGADQSLQKTEIAITEFTVKETITP